MIKKIVGFFLILLLLQFPALAQNNAEENIAESTIDKVDPSRFNSSAVLQILNKTTGKSSVITAKVGEQTKFGTLDIIVRRCWQASIDQKPESKMLIEVLENQPNNTKKATIRRIFYGWIFASSPSISGPEHPIYDITALNCK